MKPSALTLCHMAALTASSILASSSLANTLAHFDFENATFGNAANFSAVSPPSTFGSISPLSWAGNVDALEGPVGARPPNTSVDSISENGSLATGTSSEKGARVIHASGNSFAVNPTHYFSFTFTASQNLQLHSFSLDFRHPSSNASAAGNRGFEVQYSLNDQPFTLAGWGSIQGGTESTLTGPNFSLNLDNLPLNTGQKIEFRIFKTNQNGANNEVRFDNFLLNGSTTNNDNNNPNVANTDPHGYHTITFAGESINLISFNFTQPSLYQKTITNVAGHVITDAQQEWPEPGSLPAGELNNRNSDNKPLYYVEFLSGEFAEGLLIDIIDINRTNHTLTLKDDVSILLDGNESYAIRKHTTFADAFGPANSAGFLGGNTAASADQLYWINSNGNWVGNFYKTGLGANWRRVGGDASSKADSIVPVKGGLYIIRNATTPLTIHANGQLKARSLNTSVIGKAQIEIYQGNNLVSNIWPAEFTLANANLHTGDPLTGIKGGNSAASADVVYLMKNNAWIGYYVKTGLGAGWRAIDGNVSINPNDIAIKPGDALYIVRRDTAGFTWQRDLTDILNNASQTSIINPN